MNSLKDSLNNRSRKFSSAGLNIEIMICLKCRRLQIGNDLINKSTQTFPPKKHSWPIRILNSLKNRKTKDDFVFPTKVTFVCLK